MKQWISRILLAAFLVAAINDGGRFLIAAYRLDDITRTIVSESKSVAAKDPSANSGWPTAQSIAQQGGLQITGYEQSTQGVKVSTRILVTNTWLAGPMFALLAKEPLKTPVPLERTESSTP